MSFINHIRKNKSRVHIRNERWDDTYCSMLHNRMIDKEDWMVSDFPNNNNICKICLQKYQSDKFMNK